MGISAHTQWCIIHKLPQYYSDAPYCYEAYDDPNALECIMEERDPNAEN